MPETIGIYGGTFDPPHLGHLILAAESLQQLQLNRLLWVLTPKPPHKPGRPITPLPHRLEMLRRAIADTPGFELSTIEMDRPGPHYTAQTLEILRGQFPAADLAFLVGGDSLRDLPRWYRPQDILAACRFIGVMRRPGDSIELDTLDSILPGLGGKIRFVDAPRLEISSSTIRQRIASGGHFRYYLPASVYDYIQQNHLYR
ncbi:MAG: nicotinate (nicotinamide) nucleotide adenylyltransferase [Chloroflexi bacterium]|nr:MAG: nicotinate (nicotinamide) nucleotide adenylyltransferase [Chloroflexota bacterium]